MLCTPGPVPLNPETERITRTTVHFLYCPSRRSPSASPLHHSFLTRFGEKGAKTDYAMNGGPAVNVDGSERHIQVTQDGFWTLGVKTRARDITDGLSSSYMVGEKAIDLARMDNGECFGDRAPLAGDPTNELASNSIVRFAQLSPKQDTRNNCLACHNFGSSHPTGWGVAMADGSVRMMSYYTSIEIHKALSSINAGDVMDPSDPSIPSNGCTVCHWLGPIVSGKWRFHTRMLRYEMLENAHDRQLYTLRAPFQAGEVGECCVTQLSG